MPMTTRCPQCGTAFKVVPDQLRVRNGLVRCGECDTVFDGRACLVARIPEGFAPSSAAQGEPSMAGTAVSTATVSTAAAQTPDEPSGSPEVVTPASPAVVRGRSDIARRDPYVGERLASDEDVEADETGPFILDRFDAPHEVPPWESEGDLDPQDARAARGRREPPESPDEPADGDRQQRSDSLHDSTAWDRDEHSDSPHDSTDWDREDHSGARHGSAATPEQDGLDAVGEPDDQHGQPVILGESRTRYHGATDSGRAPPEFLDTDQQSRRSLLRSLWGYGCLVGLLLIAAQLVYVYRSSIADMNPQLRPLLVGLCEPLGCQVDYARHIDRISITSSSLQPPAGQVGAPRQDNVTHLVLRASLRNLYSQPQPWPALRLDLSDLSDTVVIRKILLPDDYLPPGQAAPAFAPDAELNIEVPIEVKGQHVNGFQLHKFFP